MVRKRVDERVRALLEEGVRLEQRSLIVLVGDHGKDQVVNLHAMLAKARVRARPSVLWCYKKELGFSTHKKKRMRAIKKAVSRGLHDALTDEPFELFISQTTIRWCYYRDTAKVLGSTYGMVVLQDFEALTPNLLARTIETVEGGGVVVLLLRTVNSLRQLYTMTMDVHARYRSGAAGHDVVPRFNERFILSLADCERCLVVDDELNVLPLSRKHVKRFEDKKKVASEEEPPPPPPSTAEAAEIAALAKTLEGAYPAGELVSLTKTLDQARAVLAFIDALAERRSRSVAALTAPRGRGKSAALGLCLAAAVATGYASIFLTAPQPENVKTVFEFLFIGLEKLKYVENRDYDVLKAAGSSSSSSSDSEVQVPVRVNIFQAERISTGGKTTRQVVQFVPPDKPDRLGHAELVVIDEAAALPLPIVQRLLGPYVCVLASTVTGYEGTGRALQLKLIASLREQNAKRAVHDAAANASDAVQRAHGVRKSEAKVHEQRWAASSAAAKAGFAETADNVRASSLRELSLSAPIRYAPGDAVEKWLLKALCLEQHENSAANRLVQGHPAPADCTLYEVDRDALFSYHALSEKFLQRLMARRKWIRIRLSGKSDVSKKKRGLIVISHEALYSAAHYKNSPNDLQLLSDAPAQRLFVLLGPTDEATAPGSVLPDVLVVVQVALEGAISAETVRAALAAGQRGSGDLVPWTLAQQFCDNDFAKLSGARVVRVATHPDAQRMGYGAKAMDLLVDYFEGQGIDDVDSDDDSDDDDEEEEEKAEEEDDSSVDLRTESVKPRKALPPLLSPALSQSRAKRAAKSLDWLAASFGLTEGLYEYWARAGLKPVYVRQTANDVTGENTVIMIRHLRQRSLGAPRLNFLDDFVHDARRRFAHLLAHSCFRRFDLSLCLGLLGARDDGAALAALCGNNNNNNNNGSSSESSESASAAELAYHFTPHDLKRLDLYAKNMVDHHLVADLIPRLGTLALVEGKFGGAKLSTLQAAILLGLALQRRDVDDVARELGLPTTQALALYNKAIRKFSSALRDLRARHVEATELSLDKAAARLESQKATLVTRPQALPLATHQAQAAKAHANPDALAALISDDHDDYQIDDQKATLLEAQAARNAGTVLQLPSTTKAPPNPKRPPSDDATDDRRSGKHHRSKKPKKQHKN